MLNRGDRINNWLGKLKVGQSRDSRPQSGDSATRSHDKVRVFVYDPFPRCVHFTDLDDGDGALPLVVNNDASTSGKTITS
jgi:hypothetical protein